MTSSNSADRRCIEKLFEDVCRKLSFTSLAFCFCLSLRLLRQLTRELGVNLAAVEIILNMREKMEAIQRQMEGFVQTLNQELSQRGSNRPAESGRSLVPVIQINTLTMRGEGRRGPEPGKRAGKK